MNIQQYEFYNIYYVRLTDHEKAIRELEHQKELILKDKANDALKHEIQNTIA